MAAYDAVDRIYLYAIGVLVPLLRWPVKQVTLLKKAGVPTLEKVVLSKGPHYLNRVARGSQQA